MLKAKEKLTRHRNITLGLKKANFQLACAWEIFDGEWWMLTWYWVQLSGLSSFSLPITSRILTPQWLFFLLSIFKDLFQKWSSYFSLSPISLLSFTNILNHYLQQLFFLFLPSFFPSSFFFFPSFLLSFFLFWAQHKAWGIPVPPPGTEPRPWQWKPRILTTRPSGIPGVYCWLPYIRHHSFPEAISQCQP